MAAIRPLTLIHFSDLHLWRLGLDGDLFPKRVLGLANLLRSRRRRFPPAVAEAFVAQLLREQADHVLFSGDLTTTALRAEFEAGARLLAPVLTHWDGRFHAIPGNHDRYTPRATRRRLFESLFLPNQPELPCLHDLDDTWTLVRFETTCPRLVSSRGCVTPTTLEALSRLLDPLRQQGRRIIAMGHYPLVLPPEIKNPWEHALPGAESVARILEQAGVELYLHGHKHRRWAVQRNGVLYLNSGSAGQISARPDHGPGYLRITLGEGVGPQAESVTLAGGGIAGAAPDGPWQTAPLKPHILEAAT